jgi:DnaK suppressor protein
MSRTLTPSDQKNYRQQLLAITTRLSRGVAELESEAMRPTGSDVARQQADAAVAEAEHDVTHAVLLSEEQILTEAQAALDRLATGKFGQCERCARPITKARLDAVPYARNCIHCARELTIEDAS